MSIETKRSLDHDDFQTLQSAEFEFSNPLLVVDEETQANPLYVGVLWAFHNLMIQRGYDKTELCQKPME